MTSFRTVGEVQEGGGPVKNSDPKNGVCSNGSVL